jgi:hypothetical protein
LARRARAESLAGVPTRWIEINYGLIFVAPALASAKWLGGAMVQSERSRIREIVRSVYRRFPGPFLRGIFAFFATIICAGVLAASELWFVLPAVFRIPRVFLLLTATNAVAVGVFIATVIVGYHRKSALMNWWLTAGSAVFAVLITAEFFSLRQLAKIDFVPVSQEAPANSTNSWKEILTSDKKRIVTGIFWNTWFTGEDNPPANVLAVGKDYTVNLDLSAFDYPALRADLAVFGMSVKADKALGALMTSGADSPQLTIKPIVTEGSGLSIVGPDPPLMPLNMEKIRSPDLEAAAAYAVSDKPLPVPDRMRAGWTSFMIHTREKGCPRIAFAIFNDLTPIDHLVQRIVVKDKDGQVPDCAKNLDANASALSGGLDALREASLGAGDSLIGNAALYIFDADKDNNLAVLVDGRKEEKKTVYGWRTQRSVVGYLRDKNFEQRISDARAQASKNHAGAYVLAAQDLWTELFAANDGTEGEAKAAADALTALVKASATPPVIVVRVASSVVDGKTHSLFAPFAILGARGDGAVLDKPIVVVQPMAIDRFVGKDKCIASWTLALPDQIDGDVDLSNVPAPLPGKRLKTMKEFSDFMKFSQPIGEQPSGLLVLAHQGGGELWFKQSEAHVSRIGRVFPDGSAGILSACSVAATTTRNSQLLESLNQQGLGTVISSPFALDATDGVRFAYSFAEVIQEASAKAEEPTMLELFNRAVAKTIEKFTKVKTGRYEELGLEYVLLGNPAIRLCAPVAAAKSR